MLALPALLSRPKPGNRNQEALEQLIHDSKEFAGLGFWYPSQLWGEVPPHQQTMLWVPTGCPAAQLSAHTTYPETASDPAG